MALITWMLILAATLLWSSRSGRAAAAWAAAVGWLTLPVYNAWVVARCPGDCGIRADLVLLVPVLLLLTIVALWQLVRRRRSRR